MDYREQPSAWKLLRIWSVIGAQSFGGGPATLQLIRREMIVKRGWLTDLEYSHYWTLSTLVPGINMIAFAILIGRKLVGWRGAAATLVGMLVPSTLITILLTAGFVALQSSSIFQAMLRGVIPATAAMMFVVMLNLGRPLLKESRRQGWANFGLSLVFIFTTAAMIGLLKWPVWLALLLALLAGPLLSSSFFSPYFEVKPPAAKLALSSSDDEVPALDQKERVEP